MQISRNNLTFLIAAFFALGGAMIVLMFGQSMAPTEKAKAALPRVAIPSMKAGEFAFVKDPSAFEGWPAELLMVRRENGKLNVWYVMKKAGAHVMPDVHWWRPGRLCKRFEPDFSSQIIACKDDDLEPYFQQAFRWSLEGKNLSGQMGDMLPVEGEVQLGDFVIIKVGEG